MDSSAPQSAPPENPSIADGGEVGSSPAVPDQGSLLARLLGMIRFSHTLFALPFALTAALMAWAAPAPDGSAVPFRWLHLVGLLVCMVGARSAAMAFNRLVDRHIDARNPRTQGRHLPAGTLSVPVVVLFLIASSAVFVVGTLLFLPNTMPLLLSVPVLIWLCGYSYAKRFTAMAHFWLGVALALSPVATWLALRGEWTLSHPADLLPPLSLAAVVVFWVAGFDTIYACQDQAFDADAGLHSIPSRLGVAGALRVAAACHAVMFACLWLLPWSETWGGPELGLGWIHALGAIAIGVLLLYEHWMVRPDDLARINVAFFQVNVIVAFTLLATIGLDLWL